MTDQLTQEQIELAEATQGNLDAEAGYQEFLANPDPASQIAAAQDQIENIKAEAAGRKLTMREEGQIEQLENRIEELSAGAVQSLPDITETMDPTPEAATPTRPRTRRSNAEVAAAKAEKAKLKGNESVPVPISAAPIFPEGPFHILLDSKKNTYRIVEPSSLQIEAAAVIKDAGLALVEAERLIPQIELRRGGA